MRPVLSRSARIPRAVCALALVLASLPAMARDGTGDAAACHGHVRHILYAGGFACPQYHRANICHVFFVCYNRRVTISFW